MNIRSTIQYNSDYEASRWVGFFDLLGIKKIIEDKDTVSVFVAYSTAINEMINRIHAIDDVKHAWFSDSFLIYTTDDSINSFGNIDSICRWFCYFLICYKIPIRGSIACGSFYSDIENDLFFGKALIEAYEYGEAQDLIGFILCPSASDQLRALGNPAESLFNYTYTNIPFNKRQSNLIPTLFACILGQWISPNQCITSLMEMRDRATDQRIIQKYTNTIQFIQSKQKSFITEIDL